MCTTHISEFFVMQVSFLGANWEFLLLTTRVAVKIFPPKNLIYIFKMLFFSPTFSPLFYFLLPFFYPLSYTHFSYPLTSRRNCSSSYQMSAAACGSWNPVDSNCWTLGCWTVLLSIREYFLFFLMNYEVKEFLQKIFLIQFGLELVNLGLLGCRLIH